MIGFYTDMRLGVLYLSAQKRSFILSELDIKNLPPYINAPEEYKSDFDGTVLGSLSKGSVSKSNTKVKALKSPFANMSSFNGEPVNEPVVNQPFIHESYVSPINEETPIVFESPSDSNQKYESQVSKQYYYEPDTLDKTDTLIA